MKKKKQIKKEKEREREDAQRRCQQKEERKPVEHKTTPRLRERTFLGRK